MTYAVVVPFAIFLAFPFYFALVTMFKTNLDLANVEHSPYLYNDVQGGFHWDFWNYATTEHVRFLFEDTNYPKWLLNTLLVGAAVVVITLLLAMPAGYALARLAGPWGQSAGVAIFLIYLIPPTLLFLPLSRLITQLDLKDSLWSLILVYPSFTVPFATWLLMGFFKTIPQELEDAALIDGASRLKALYLIVLPISLPGILTVVIFAFSLCVNEFIYAFTFISSSEQRTVSAGRSERPDPRRRLLLAVAHGRRPDPDDPARAPLQRLSRPLHQGLYRRGISLENRAERRDCPCQR